jgi:hypothetical protein
MATESTRENTPDYSYLDSEARSLAAKYPHCKSWIAELAVDYQRRLATGEFIADTSDGVVEDFQDAVSRHCHIPKFTRRGGKKYPKSGSKGGGGKHA